MGKIRIILIEDTLFTFQNCKNLLGGSYEVLLARSPDQAWALLEQMKSDNQLPTAIILDLSLVTNPIDGLRILAKLKDKYPDMPVVVWTKHVREYGSKALEAGAKEVIEKHIEDDRLEPVIRRIVKAADEVEK